MAECRVDLRYNKQRVNAKNGKASLYLEIVVGTEIDYIPLKGYRWDAIAFDWNKRSIVERHSNDHDLITYRAIIEAERNKYWSVIKKFLLQNRAFTLADVYKGIALSAKKQKRNYPN